MLKWTLFLNKPQYDDNDNDNDDNNNDNDNNKNNGDNNNDSDHYDNDSDDNYWSSIFNISWSAALMPCLASTRRNTLARRFFRDET